MEMFSGFIVKRVMHTACDEPHLRSLYFCICTRFLMSIKQTKHIKQAHNFPGEILLFFPLSFGQSEISSKVKKNK